MATVKVGLAWKDATKIVLGNRAVSFPSISAGLVHEELMSIRLRTWSDHQVENDDLVMGEGSDLSDGGQRQQRPSRGAHPNPARAVEETKRTIDRSQYSETRPQAPNDTAQSEEDPSQSS